MSRGALADLAYKRTTSKPFRIINACTSRPTLCYYILEKITLALQRHTCYPTLISFITGRTGQWGGGGLGTMHATSHSFIHSFLPSREKQSKAKQKQSREIHDLEPPFLSFLSVYDDDKTIDKPSRFLPYRPDPDENALTDGQQ